MILLRQLLDRKVKLVPVAVSVVIGGCLVYLSGDEAASSGKGTASAVRIESSIDPDRENAVPERLPVKDSPAESFPSVVPFVRDVGLKQVTDSQAPNSSANSNSLRAVTSEIGHRGQSLAAEFDSPASIGGEEQFVEANPSAPGHSITSLGVRVAVEGQITDFSGEPKGLEFSAGPVENASADATKSGAKAQREQVKRGSYVAGFSPEDALFRMKWGWTAYDAAKRVARESQ